MIVAPITDHVQKALDRLLQQYKGQPRIQALITALVEQIQDLEDAMYPLDAGRELQYSVGAQLDGIGQLVGLSRNGLTDAEYFILLIGTISENYSDTTIPTMLTIIQQLFQATNVFIWTPNSPGSGPSSLVTPAVVAFSVGGAQTDSDLYGEVEQIIFQSLGAAINLVYLSTHEAERVFSTAGPQSWVAGPSNALDPQPTDAHPATLIYNNLSQ